MHSRHNRGGSRNRERQIEKIAEDSEEGTASIEILVSFLVNLPVVIFLFFFVCLFCKSIVYCLVWLFHNNVQNVHNKNCLVSFCSSLLTGFSGHLIHSYHAAGELTLYGTANFYTGLI